ncbi:hypothetical protein PPACK8108_LOCUS20626 [Phakopsora pachyrhizi]|uniref:Uncharacterized protein n=1 Tax=Phakopsora pachyrhizi TaxID=170000 RepID=A0AAV0BKG3_PHAPC|nr:hypothetical protein PPACK8108_LOCUS20626 [Phakopsora pachyrhizi]
MVSEVRDFYKQNRTCCIVIPLFQGGHVIIGLVQPKFMSYLYGVLYATIALIQPYGILCAERNMMNKFRTFKNLSLGASGVALMLAFISILVSSAQHNTSISECMNVYQLPISSSFKKRIEESKVTSSDAAVNSAMIVCDLYSWFQLGVMTFCWILILSIQVYFETKKKVFFELKYEDFLEDQSRVKS